MKVVQVLPALRGGGVEKGTLEVAQYLVDQGHESIVVSAGGQMVSQLEAEGSRHIAWDLGRKSVLTFRHVWAFRRFLKQEKPDILHLRSRMPAWVAWLAWRGLPKNQRPRLITTVHGLYSVSGYSKIMCRGDVVIAVSDTVKAYIEANYPDTPKDCIRVIYRGVDAKEFPYQYQPPIEWCSRFYQEFPQLSGRKILCLPGRLTRLKGHHDFIDMIESLSKVRGDIVGLIVGGEDPKRVDYANELYKRVERLGLSDKIIFTGARTDIREIFSISAIVYSLSNKPESFGRTVLEALRLGRPVVGYDHGGVGEILQQIYPTGAVTLKDQDQLQARSRALIDTDIDTESVVPESHLFTKQEMLRQTLQVYES